MKNSWFDWVFRIMKYRFTKACTAPLYQRNTLSELMDHAADNMWYLDDHIGLFVPRMLWNDNSLPPSRCWIHETFRSWYWRSGPVSLAFFCQAFQKGVFFFQSWRMSKVRFLMSFLCWEFLQKIKIVSLSQIYTWYTARCAPTRCK